MSTLLNKSNHPVQVKKIPITVWSLRDEIEAAIKQKIEENGGTTDNLDISEIQNFYSNLKTYEDLPKKGEEDAPDGDLDPNGNPMDDDAKAMMEAMGGGGDDSSEDKSEEEAEANNDESESENSEEDDAAAALAAEMLGDQGGGDSSESSADKDAEGDQGSDNTSEEKTSKNSKKGFQRVFPEKKSRDFGFVFLSDLNMEQALIFTRKKYMTGSNIIIEFEAPRKFTLTAEVVTSFAVNMNSRVISETKPNFRIQCKLHFSFEGERTFLREFLKQVEPDVPPPLSKLKKPATQEDDEDEFDDLGF